MAKVRIFSTPACPYCVTIKEFFKDHNVEFEEINVAEDAVAREEMVKKSNQMGVPVLEINGQIVIGFDRKKLFNY